MRHAVYLPVMGEFADAALLSEMAGEADRAGWDGVFIWDHVAMWWDRAAPVVDATVALGAIAIATNRVRFGALVTPLARRRPHKFARETASLDRLSGGRLVVGVGLGANEHEFDALGEESDDRRRADLLDEGLDVVMRLWSGEPVEHDGAHHRVSAQFLPVPLQQPRIPVWVAAAWPHRRPLRRAARFDGVVPMLAEPGPYDTPPDVYRELLEVIRPLRTDPSAPFDVTHVHGDPDIDLDRRKVGVARYADAGPTWWLEDVGPWRWGVEPLGPWPLDDMRSFIRAGPARP
jgi:alkanesulfonate monooxygenase SsuD/methylene tetrahydromethanopterin reductase-like flavin-dependent oxidoreductase (luciferase family)